MWLPWSVVGRGVPVVVLLTTDYRLLTTDIMGDLMIPLLAIVGPTAVGKTAISLEVARKIRSEIISADSMQVYRHLNIGTAKPSDAERKAIPHHLVDAVEPEEDYNVARYQQEAGRFAKKIFAKGKLPLLVGGTGLYVNALVYGYEFSRQEGSAKIRESLLEEARLAEPGLLHKRLKNLDPAAAEKIHPHDTRRVVRALEVFSLTGKSITGQVKATTVKEPVYKSLIVGINRPREELYRRIDSRVDQMMQDGLLEEVKSLLARGYLGDLKSFQGLGYRHMVKYLQREISLADAISELKRDTRRLAKRQLTWFRKDKRITWFVLGDDDASQTEVVEKICSLTAGEFPFCLELGEV